MAISLQLPPGAEDKYQEFRKKLSNLLGNIFDPNDQTAPPMIPGMGVERPLGIGEHMKNLVTEPTYKEFIGNSVLGVAGSGAMPMHIAQNYRTPEAIQALRRAMAAENRARGAMGAGQGKAIYDVTNSPWPTDIGPAYNAKMADEMWKGKALNYSDLENVNIGSQEALDQILRGSWFHGMRPEARNALESLENAKGGGREWFGGLKLPQEVADNWQNYQGIHSSIYPEFNLLRANEMGLPGSTHATPSYTRFGEPFGTSITASPSIAKNFSADDYIHRVQPLYGGPPTEAIIPMWRPEGQKAMNEGYNTAFNEYILSQDIPNKMGGYYPSPVARMSREVNKGDWLRDIPSGDPMRELNDTMWSSIVGNTTEDASKFNTLYSKALQDQGKRGILYSPQRYGEYEMLMLDPSFVRPLDYRKAEDFISPRTNKGLSINTTGPTPAYKPVGLTPYSTKGYEAAQPEFATGATRLSDVFNQQSWVDRINEENKKRIMEMIDAQYREQVGNQLFGGK